jgi:hypothetical protein
LGQKLLLIEIALPEADHGGKVHIILGILWATSAKSFATDRGRGSTAATSELAVEVPRCPNVPPNELPMVAAD